jgi:uncharacterized membrane protein
VDTLAENLRDLWERLRTHILFLPGTLVFLGIVLAVALVEVDRRVDTETIRQIPWFFRAGASGARDVLATIATSMAQLAGITFSVTVVALALRSQQFGPRLLRNFTRDKLNQVILGTFIGTFVYALLVLRAVRDLEDENLDDATFVPLLAITGAILLALVSLGFFIVFIDRIVSSIQANSIIAEAARETHEAIDHLFPEPLGEEDDSEDEIPPLVGAAVVIAPETGYIQTVKTKRLMKVVRKADVVLRMEAPIGGFVVKGTPLATVKPAGRLDDELMRDLQKVYSIGKERSVVDDPEFGVQQIVDVAVKALSPSMNDPTTAVTATEFLGALVIDFSTRSIPSRLRRDEEGKLRVIAFGPTFRSMADVAFNQIREHGHTDVAVTLKLLETLIRVAGTIESEGRRAVLAEHVWKVSRGAAQGIQDPVDREAVNRRLNLAMERLGKGESGASHYLLPLSATSTSARAR